MLVEAAGGVLGVPSSPLAARHPSDPVWRPAHAPQVRSSGLSHLETQLMHITLEWDCKAPERAQHMVLQWQHDYISDYMSVIMPCNVLLTQFSLQEVNSEGKHDMGEQSAVNHMKDKMNRN